MIVHIFPIYSGSWWILLDIIPEIGGNDKLVPMKSTEFYRHVLVILSEVRHFVAAKNPSRSPNLISILLYCGPQSTSL